LGIGIPISQRCRLMPNYFGPLVIIITNDINDRDINDRADDGREFRALVIEIVLATDMSFHFQQIKNMRNLLSMPEK